MASSPMISILMFSIFVIFSNEINRISANTSIHVAPYYMPLENQLPIDEILAQSSLKNFILAFVLASNNGGCVPTWDGINNVSDDQTVLELIRKIRSVGGDVSVSFGGYNGIELGHACQSPEDLARAYQTVIDKYQLTNIDFDIEGSDLGSVVEERRRFEAIKILKRNAQQNGRNLYVSLTLPTTVLGMNDVGKEEIRLAIESGLEIDLYTLMAFDFGGAANQQVEQVRSIMDHFREQLKSLHPGWSDQELSSHSGMILMNGHTDQPSELYTTDTFRQLMNYANEKGLSRVSFWSLNRDRKCPTDRPIGWVNAFCSNLEQQPYEFSRIINTLHQYDEN